jgi:beta-glucosidase
MSGEAMKNMFQNRLVIFFIFLFIGVIMSLTQVNGQTYSFKKFIPPVDYKTADARASEILSKLTLEDKIHLIGGERFFYIKGFEKHGIPSLYLSDATQGVHIRKDLNDQMEKSTAFPCPSALTATWNIELAYDYAKSIGEECLAGGISVLLGPGMNIYRVSQNGRNFEYFGEDPFLASRMVENYVVGVQGTGTMATLKHFLLNNTEFYRRKSNSIVDERTIHEIYTPAFKAGIDAGAMAVMTSYNQINGEWAAQSKYVITDLLRNELGFKGLVMSDWWSTWDPVKTMQSGLDLEMPGEVMDKKSAKKEAGDIYVKASAAKLIREEKVSEDDINRMAKNILRSSIQMGLYDRPVKDESYLKTFPDHEKVALQTARESVVLLKNSNSILPILPDGKKRILLTGDYTEKIARGGGSAEVLGYNSIVMREALKNVYGNQLVHTQNATDEQIKSADVVLLSIGTDDSEGWDKPFSLSTLTEEKILKAAGLNPNVVVIVNTGGGIKMTDWNDKVSGILYAWYPGQNGNVALAEIISGKTNPSGKLPITIEKRFEDSPGANYLAGEELYNTWVEDTSPAIPIRNVKYDEGIFVGYRWYESRNIEPLYHFGFGLSYTKYEYSNLKLSGSSVKEGKRIKVSFNVKNTGSADGKEIAQLYIKDVKSSVPRPLKELKGFSKVALSPGETKKVELTLSEKDFSFWDVNKKSWYAEPGEFVIMVGAASNDIRLVATVVK